MKPTNSVFIKAKHFALRIVKLHNYLCTEKNEYTLSKQLLRSGTSIGANLAESNSAISRKDFLNKIYIVLKVCEETLYWIDLLHDAEYLTDAEHVSIITPCDEIRRMLSSTTKTMTQTLEKY